MFSAAPFASTPFGGAPVVAAPPVDDSITLPVVLTVAGASAEVSLPVVLSVAEPVSIELPVVLAVTTPASGAVWAKWRVQVTIDGVDVSDRVVADISTDASEGGSRLAQFALVPVAGQIDLPAWSGRVARVSAVRDDGSESFLLFSGRVDVPRLDEAKRVVTLSCVASIQAACANAPQDLLAELIGGRFSASVFGAVLDGWQFARAVMETVPAALDMSVDGALRVTPWAAKAVADFAFGSSAVVDGSVRVDLQTWADLRNRVEYAFEYRYPLLHQRFRSLEWRYLSLARVAEWGLDLPSREMVQQAVDSVDGWMPGKVFFDAVPAGAYLYGPVSSPVILDIPEWAAPQLCQGFSVAFRARWVQSVTERSMVRARCVRSIEAYGDAVESRLVGSMQADFDATDWLEAPVGVGETTSVTPWGLPGVSDRVAADLGRQVAMDMAVTRVMKSNRGTTVQFDVPLTPLIDVRHTGLLDLPTVRAKGKVVGVRHRLNIDTGRGVTTVVLAISGHGVVGTQPYVEPVAPVAPQPVAAAPVPGLDDFKADVWIGGQASTPPFDPDSMFGFSTNRKTFPSPTDPQYDPENAEQYPHAFSIRSAQIEAADRDAATVEASTDVDVVVPVDDFEVF